MSDSPENLPETPASGVDADGKRRAAIKAGLLAAPAILTLMTRSSLALADNNGTPGAASAGSTSVVRDNNGNHYGWDKSNGQGNSGQANGNTPTFAGDPKPSTPASDATSSSSSAGSSSASPSATSSASLPATAESSKDKEDVKTTGVGSVSK